MTVPIQASPPDQRKHWHYFLPIFQLRYFADPAAANGGVWVHDRQQRLRPNPKCLPPVAIAAEQELYTVHGETGTKSDAYENWLAVAIDGPAAAAFPKLVEGAALSGGERSAIARYVMSRDLRTPKAQAFIMRWEQQLADAAWAALKRDIPGTRAKILSEGGIDFTEEEIGYYLETLDPEASNNAFVAFMDRHLDRGARRLFSYNWLLVRPLIGQRYIATSDLGIVKFGQGFHNPVDHMIGWIAKAEGWVTPRTPHAALVMAPGTENGVAIATSEFLLTINTQLAAQAEALVFASQPHAWVLRSWGM